MTYDPLYTWQREKPRELILQCILFGHDDLAAFRLSAKRDTDILLQPDFPLTAGMSVLDFGCGIGRIAREVIARVPGIAVTACDVHAGTLELCREYAPEATPVLHTGCLPLPFADHQFDAVYSLLCLQHLPTPMVLMTLDDLLRVTRPGGRLCLQLIKLMPHTVRWVREHAYRIYKEHRADGHYLEAWTEEQTRLYVEATPSARLLSLTPWPQSIPSTNGDLEPVPSYLRVLIERI